MPTMTLFPGCCAADIMHHLPYKLEGDAHSEAYKKLADAQLEVSKMEGRKFTLAIALPQQVVAMKQLGFEVVAELPGMYNSNTKLHLMCRIHSSTAAKK